MIDLVWLAVSIALVVVLIVRIKLHPAMALIIGIILLGLTTQVPLANVAEATVEGFGSMMAGIGLSIGFGIILGQLMSDCGAARVIARTLVRVTSERFSMYGIAATAFILSIPVFYDVTFIILIPLAISIAREANKPLPLAVGSVALGAGVAHTLVPPTPNPLVAGEILGFDVGTMLLLGSVAGFIALMLAVTVYSWLLPKIWNPAMDEDSTPALEVEPGGVRTEPGFLLALLPIATPVLLILVDTFWSMFADEQPAWVTFIGDKTVALLIGAIVAYLVASKSMNRHEKDDSADTAVRSAGLVLLVTGAGGALGAVIQGAGVDETITDSVTATGGNYIVALLVCYAVGIAFRVATGSGTVATITTMTIMVSVAGAVDVHPVWVAMACMAGALSFGHINDSGFWITAKLLGYSITGSLKTYTTAQTITGFFVILLSLLGTTVIPIQA